MPSWFNIFWIIVKSIIVPILSILALSKYNLFSVLSSISEDKQFDFGLAMYIAFFEVVIEFVRYCIKNYISKRSANIKCVFYKDERREDSRINPIVEMSSDMMQTGKIWCHIIVEGNPNVLKQLQLNLDIPRWFSVQCDSNCFVTHSINQLIWEIALLLPDSTNDLSCYADNRIQINFISNTADDNSIELQPHISGKSIKKRFVKLKTNRITIKNLR